MNWKDILDGWFVGGPTLVFLIGSAWLNSRSMKRHVDKTTAKQTEDIQALTNAQTQQLADEEILEAARRIVEANKAQRPTPPAPPQQA